MSSVRRAQTLSALREQFDAVLEPGPHGYYAGGSGDEVTLAANERAWSEYSIHPSVMVDVSRRDPSVELLGRRMPHPLICAPFAYHRLAWPDGECATALGCGQANATYCLSTLATSRPAEVATAAPGTHRWFQIYVFKDRAVTDDLVAEAVDNGFEALVLTVDLPVLGKRERDIQNNFTIGDAELVPGVAAAGGKGLISMQDTADLIDPSLTWKDVERFAAQSPLPVIVKGILRPDDARKAIASGARGVVVSNHGGRQLDCVPATASVLPSIAEEVNSEVALIVDGGIRRGTDVLIALALGADAVMVGRPILWGLAAEGATGVETAFEILIDEFDRALALSGCPAAADLSEHDHLVTPAKRSAL